MIENKIDNYLTESTTINRFGKLISKYTNDLKKIQDKMYKDAQLLVKQVNDPEELEDMLNMMDSADEIQDAIMSIIDDKIDNLR